MLARIPVTSQPSHTKSAGDGCLTRLVGIATPVTEAMEITESTKSNTDRDLIRVVVEFAAAPKVTSAFVSAVHNGQLVLGGWLPPLGAPRHVIDELAG